MPMLRGVGSKRLRCGCLLGVFEAPRGVVTTIEKKNPFCPDATHRVNGVIPLPPQCVTRTFEGGRI